MSPATRAPGRVLRRIGLWILLVPIVEITVAVVVARWIGGGPTLLLILLLSALGLVLVRREGVGVLRRWRSRGTGRVGATEVGDTGLRLLAAVLLVIPGLVTGLAGLLLLLPPIRAAVAHSAGRRLRARLGGAARRVTLSGEVVEDGTGNGVTVTSWVEDLEQPRRLPPSP